MRAVLCVVALLALSAAVEVSARRIHRLKQELVEAEDIDAEASLPFDGAYWDSVKPDYTKSLEAEAKKGQLDNSAILNKFFSAENILLAQQQGANAVATVGTFTASAFTKVCNEGTCDDKWTEKVITGNLNKGGAGNVVLTCTVPADLKTTVCNTDFTYDSTTLMSCANVGGGAARKCSNPRFQRYSSGAGAWMMDDVIINAGAQGSVLSDQYVTADAQTVNWRYFGNDPSTRKLTFTAVFIQTGNWKAYKPVVSPAQPAPSAELVKAQKAAVINTAAIIKKFFNAENILLAQQQGASMVSTIAKYKAAAITRTCNVGACTAYTAVEMSGNLFKGAEGSVVLTCTAPADMATSVCNIDVVYESVTMMSCPAIGGAGPKCSAPRPQRYSSGAGAWMMNDFITTNTEIAEVFFTNDQLVVHFRFRGNNSNRQLVFSDFTMAAPFAGYQYIVAPAQPAPAPELVQAQKAAKLNTQQLLDKFFNKDNIQLAQMQGSSIPVRATIAGYTATAITRTCNVGACSAYTPVEMSGNLFKGAEGSVVLTCTVPADLKTSKCQIDFIYEGTTLMSCPDIGNGGKCSAPRPQRYSSGAGAWMMNDFIATTTEIAEVLFTNDNLVVHFRFRGNNSNRQLTFSDFTAVTSSLTDFGIAAKTNCLSKTTADAVLAAAAANKGLKNKIVLQKPVVEQLIKSAPYKTVEDAVKQIKGIGPVNVVYVSFMWNFSC